MKQLLPRNAAYDQVLQKNEQMYALLALVVALCPSVQSGLDEHVLAALKDKFGEKLQVRWHPPARVATCCNGQLGITNTPRAGRDAF